MKKTLEVMGMVCPFPLIEAKNELLKNSVQGMN